MRGRTFLVVGYVLLPATAVIMPVAAIASTGSGPLAAASTPTVSSAPAPTASGAPASTASGGFSLSSLIVAVALAAMAISLVTRFRAGRRLFEDDDAPRDPGDPRGP